MKKILLLTLLVSEVVYGNWTQIYKDNKLIHYVDYTTIVKVGSYTRIWSKDIYLEPLKTNLGKIHSVNSYDEIDCKQNRRRMIAYDSYSDVLQQHIVERKTLNEDWVYFRPGTIGFEELGGICNR